LRLWSISPRYLDPKGLVALWREALLARKVLEGLTKGYKNHPQLARFKQCSDPRKAINTYLYYVWVEGKRRGFSFQEDKIKWDSVDTSLRIPVSEGQLKYEVWHLLKKVSNRNPAWFHRLLHVNCFEPNPLFYAIPGCIELWEKVPEKLRDLDLTEIEVGTIKVKIKLCA